MKLYKLSILTVALAAGLTSCSDWLEQEPVSQIAPDGFMNKEANLLATVDKLYTDILPSHGNNSYGLFGNDVNTDNMANRSGDGKYGTKLWNVGTTNSNWAWGNIRNVNYWLNESLASYKAKGISGTDKNIRQYIGELYFFRAYCYFDMLQKWGDLPIITESLTDEEAVLVAANKRTPCNDVARFIISDLDSATTFMQPDFEAHHTRVSYDAAMLLKSRVALYEGSWLKNFANSPFVPNGPGWPGAKKDYLKNYQFKAGSIEKERDWFFKTAAEAAQIVADRYKSKLVVNTGTVPQKESDPENPYLSLWGTIDMSKTPEILLWREYSNTKNITNNVECAVQQGNYLNGLTRSMVEGYLMKDGKPIYASEYKYSDQTIADVAKNRDPRLTVFLKVPGQTNVFKNMSFNSDRAVTNEPMPSITVGTIESGYSTGYAIRKGGTFDKSLTINNGGYTACALFRATEALLNYMEAEYELTHNVNSGNILEYWKDVRHSAGFTGAAADPMTTINATDLSKEPDKTKSQYDWGLYSAGQKLTDKVLYCIRRERRSELIAEGLRWMDLQRWRSLDQLIDTPVHIEGMNLWGSDMHSKYVNADGSSLLHYDGDGTGATPNVTSPKVSNYLRPLEFNKTSNYINGFTWHLAHYLQPLPIKEFLLTATDHASIDQSPLYQNPYWPTEADMPAEK